MVAQRSIVHINHNSLNQTSIDIILVVSNYFTITNSAVMNIFTKIFFQISVMIYLELIPMNNFMEF